MKVNWRVCYSLAFVLVLAALAVLTACQLANVLPHTQAGIPITSPTSEPLSTPLAPPSPIEAPSSVVSTSTTLLPTITASDLSTSPSKILITPNQAGQLIHVLVGQVITVTNPGLSTEWQVDYASEVLVALTPAESLHAPGPEGWRFLALAPGRTDLVLTSIPLPCSKGTPCPPMAARFVFTFDVSR